MPTQLRRRGNRLQVVHEGKVVGSVALTRKAGRVKTRGRHYGSLRRGWRYGTFMMLPTAGNQTNEALVKGRLDDVKALGIGFTWEALSTTLTDSDLTNLLTWYATRDMKLILKYGAIAVVPDPANPAAERAWLDVVGQHPNFMAYFTVDEPFNAPVNYTVAQMRQLYTSLKSSHPHVKQMVSWSGQITQGAPYTNLFGTGMADIHNINIQEFDSDPADVLDDGFARLQRAVGIIRQRDGSAEVQCSCNVHLPDPNPRNLFNPTAGQMESLVLRVWQDYGRDLKSFVWSVWESATATDVNISDSPALQSGVAHIYNRYVRYG